MASHSKQYISNFITKLSLSILTNSGRMEIIMYSVQSTDQPIRGIIEVPGSKSITNRALLLASIAKGKSRLSNVLFSDDTRHFMKCLQSLGFNIQIDELNKVVDIVGGRPLEKATIDVGSAGTAARFLTAYLAHFPGEYVISASEQMKKRPMKPLLDVLSHLGADIKCLESDGHLPIKMIGGTLTKKCELALSGEQSSQYLSALLLSGNLLEQMTISPIGSETAKAYIEMTLKMIIAFGGNVSFENGTYVVRHSDYTAQDYMIEPDVSSACYFYAMAALTGGSVTVKNVHPSSLQGDIKFLDVLRQLGCEIVETAQGVQVNGKSNGKYHGIEVDMNDFSDQTMTLAALAVFADSPTTIHNINHMQFQETDRITAIIAELTRMGIRCERTSDGIVIYPGSPKPTDIQTYDDHRMAMAFSLIGLRSKGIRIMDHGCTRKTFENYFDLFSSISS